MKKHAKKTETNITILYIGIACVLIGIIVAIMLYGPPDQRLLRAVQTCDVQAAEKAVQQGADTNVRSDEDALVTGAPVLFLAVKTGCQGIMDLLLTHKADVNATVTGRVYRGWTALMIAADTGETTSVQLLLTHQADANLTIPDGEKQGWTALQIARAKEREDIVRLLEMIETQ